MRVVAVAIAIASGYVLASQAHAQGIDVAPSAVRRCLTWTEKGIYPFPLYPTRLRLLGQGGRVKVELSFVDARTAPKVDLLESEGDAEFVGSVLYHSIQYRLPCMEADERQARLVLDFVFRPDDPDGSFPALVDPQEQEHMKMRSCVVHPSGKTMPEYPESARRNAIAGRVLANMQFDAPDQPPTVSVFSRPRSVELRRLMHEWARELRMPCHQGGPVKLSMTYLFRFTGKPFGFLPGTTIGTVLQAMRHEDRQLLPRDTMSMRCPFDVAMQYRQPDQPNQVLQFGSYNPARQPVVEWLQKAQFDLPEKVADAIYGDTVVFSIPCLAPNSRPQAPQGFKHVDFTAANLATNVRAVLDLVRRQT